MQWSHENAVQPWSLTLLVHAFNKVEGARDDGIKGIHEVQQKGTIARPSGSWLPSNAIRVWLLQRDTVLGLAVRKLNACKEYSKSSTAS